jgi:hypothetical protein
MARRSAPRSPWQKAFAERLIGSIRREWLDHVIVSNERALRRLPTSSRRAAGRLTRAALAVAGSPIARP